jgi:hypothetical protein
MRRELSASSLPLCGMRITVVSPPGHDSVSIWSQLCLRLVLNYERKVQTSETLIEVAMIRFLLARLRSR